MIGLVEELFRRYDEWRVRKGRAAKIEKGPDLRGQRPPEPKHSGGGRSHSGGRPHSGGGRGKGSREVVIKRIRPDGKDAPAFKHAGRKGVAALSHMYDYTSQGFTKELRNENGEAIRNKEEANAHMQTMMDLMRAANKDKRDYLHQHFVMSIGRFDPNQSGGRSNLSDEDLERLNEAAAATLKEALGDKAPYVYSIHTDTDNPHVHVTLPNCSYDGKALHFSNAELLRWRKIYARELRARGFDAVATSKSQQKAIETLKKNHEELTKRNKQNQLTARQKKYNGRLVSDAAKMLSKKLREDLANGEPLAESRKRLTEYATSELQISDHFAPKISRALFVEAQNEPDLKTAAALKSLAKAISEANRKRGAEQERSAAKETSRERGPFNAPRGPEA